MTLNITLQVPTQQKVSDKQLERLTREARLAAQDLIDKEVALLKKQAEEAAAKKETEARAARKQQKKAARKQEKKAAK